MGHVKVNARILSIRPNNSKEQRYCLPKWDSILILLMYTAILKDVAICDIFALPVILSSQQTFAPIDVIPQ